MPYACSRMSDSEGCGRRESTGDAPFATAGCRFVGGVVLDSFRGFGDGRRLDQGGILMLSV